MQRAKSHKSYAIGPKIRALRQARRWTQAELAKELDLSQARLSELERGDGSFTAEQLLEVLRLFNVPVDHFAPKPAGLEVSLQNALARLGATHLRESTDVLPSERLVEVNDVVREVLVAPESPRLVTALAPVLVSQLERVSLNRLWAELREFGLERRLGWVVGETLSALEQVRTPARAWARPYRRAIAQLSNVLAVWRTSLEALPPSAPDIMDASLRSSNTIAEAQRAASESARVWNIVTTLRTDDFVEALRAVHEAR